MAKKLHKSARGVTVNFDELNRKNSTVVAVGNARMNARGDRLGPGGQVVQKVEDIPKHKLADPNAAYDASNKKSVKLVSLKDNILGDQVKAEDAKTPEELVNELDAKKQAKIQAAKNTTSQPSKPKETSKNRRKIVDSED